jgi:sterol desaturase/sphingolipid hydroxylase (fatty acid hydroxylase superfamily)
MNFIQFLCISAIFVGFGAFELLTGEYKNWTASKDDWKIESAMLILLLVVIQPTILAGIYWLGRHYYPGMEHAAVSLPWWGMLLILLVADDLTQYWWHRISHSPTLWPLHRAHHSAAYMSVRVVYRNNFFYYAMMPGIWISAVLVYLGFGTVYVAYMILKLAVIIGAHSTVRWDEPLYKIRFLKPVMWVVERTISTPATHYAHHALTNEDGIGHFKGNFGNLLFFWDVLFGTALITRQFPARTGLPDDITYGKENWIVELFFPIFKSKRSHSALGKQRIIVE